MMKKNIKKIGIIGGAGPLASSLLYKKIVEECYKKVKLAEDFPEIIILNYPFSSGRKHSESVQRHNILISELQHCINLLSNANANILAIACNTLHLFIRDINVENNQILIHLIDQVKHRAKICNLKKILVLGTQTTIKNQLYEDNAYSSCYLNSENQLILDAIIEQLLSGIILETDALKLANLIDEEYIKHSFEGVVFGCTDLSIIHDKFNLSLPALVLPLDTIAILAEEIVKSCYAIDRDRI